MEDRFWALVEKTDGCWLWTGCPTGSNGYGRISIGGNKGRCVAAYRYSFLLHYGPFDQRLLVCHTCDTPLCVRPEHLFLGTPKDNSMDMVTKGRHHEKAKRACLRGHEFTPENTYVDGGGKRACRTCRADKMRRLRPRYYGKHPKARGWVEGGPTATLRILGSVD